MSYGRAWLGLLGTFIAFLEMVVVWGDTFVAGLVAGLESWK